MGSKSSRCYWLETYLIIIFQKFKPKVGWSKSNRGVCTILQKVIFHRHLRCFLYRIGCEYSGGQYRALDDDVTITPGSPVRHYDVNTSGRCNRRQNSPQLC